MKVLVFALILFTQSPACMAQTQVRESSCAYTVKLTSGPNAGSTSTVGDRFLRVLGQVASDRPFKLPKDAPEGVDSITCYRSSPVLAEGDARIADAGIAFFVHSGQVSVFLHLNHRKSRTGKYAVDVRGPIGKLQRSQIDQHVARLNGGALISRIDP